MKKSTVLLLIIVLVALGFVGWRFLLADNIPPSASLEPDTLWVSKNTEFTVKAQDAGAGLSLVSVRAVRGDQHMEIVRRELTGEPSVEISFGLGGAPLDDGGFGLEVEVVDAAVKVIGERNKTLLTKTMTLDTQPPIITSSGPLPAVAHGGTGAVSFQVSEEPSQCGVAVGDLFFPAYPEQGGRWFCLFAYPWFMDADQFTPVLTAVDAAGNSRQQSLDVNKLRRNFREDVLNISDGFLRAKMPYFEQYFPGQMDDLERFLKVNKELRADNNRTIKEIGLRSEPARLWSGVFLRMPGTQAMARFADHRKYKHGDQIIDEQTHLGQDLASVRNDVVPAGNGGRVAFADSLGIYGLTVILDHGQGLMTLYSHLSEFAVREGDTVSKGQALGKTGTTGMAGGDHLHFGVLVSGLPVEPIEWWDAAWIENRILNQLK